MQEAKGSGGQKWSQTSIERKRQDTAVRKQPLKYFFKATKYYFKVLLQSNQAFKAQLHRAAKEET